MADTSTRPVVRHGWAVRHEWVLASVAALVLAVLMIWLLPPLVLDAVPGHEHVGVADPVTTIIGDAADPTGQAWLLAWAGWSAKHGFAGLWDTNAFYPDHNGLAFNDSLLGYLPFGLAGSGPAAALLRYNLVYVLAFALAALGMYALARQLGASPVAGALAGAAYAYAPWRYGHDGHLNILSSGGIVLALAMLARGHGWSLRRGYRPERRRPGWAGVGWLVAAWQVSLGFGIGLPFVYVMLLVVVVATAGWLVAGRPPLGRRLLLADLGGGLVFAAVSGLFALPYLAVRELNPASARSLSYISLFSPPVRGFLIAPRSSLIWGDVYAGARDALAPVANEKTLLCGLVLYALALAGLVRSVWPARTRLLLAAGVLAGMAFALGTNGPAYILLWRFLPGFDGSRTPGRLVLWPTILLCLLAAGFVTALGDTVRERAPAATARVLARAVTVPLVVLVLIEGLPDMDHVAIAGEPAAMAAAHGPLIVLPSDESIDLNVMLWSTNGFPAMVNGAGSLVTPGHQAIRDLLTRFPDADSVRRLRSIGIRTVIVLPGRLPGTPYQSVPGRPISGLGITRTQIGDDLLYTLD